MSPTAECSVDKSEKIGGYDRWKVSNAVDTMKQAKEIEADPKFLKVVLAEMDREANKLEKTAEVLRNTKSNLDKVFKKEKK